jgi:hypothetical protein
MNFKEIKRGCQYRLLYAKETRKTHSRQIFSRPPKIILQIWPTDIFLQRVLMLHGQDLCK